MDGPSTSWLLFLVALAAILVGLRLSWLGEHVALAYNEGWNAALAQRLFAGLPLYPPPDGLLANNYPPLSFYLVGGLGQMIGDTIVAGRIVSVLAVTATTGAIVAIVRRFANGPTPPLLAASLFVILIAGPARAYFATNDPQWIGHALMSWGVVALLPRERSGPAFARVAAAALLMLAGGLVKHNLLGFPLAATLWLALHHRRALAVWLAVGIGGATAAVMTLDLLYGPDIWSNLLLPRRLLLDRFWPQLLVLPMVLLPVAAFARRLIARRGADRRIDLVLLLAATSLAIGAVQRLGEGVAVNAYFEAIVALSVVVGAAVDDADLRRLASPYALFWVAIPIVAVGLAFAIAGAREVANRTATIRNKRSWIVRVAAIPGPVACVDLALCYWAGKPFVLDPFNYSERLRTGTPPTVLVEALARQRFVAAQTDPTGGFTPAQCAHPDHAVTVIACRWRSAVHEPTGGYQLWVPSSVIPTSGRDPAATRRAEERGPGSSPGRRGSCQTSRAAISCGCHQPSPRP